MEPKNELYQLFEDFATQSECNYLTVPMQTGSGKTHTSVQFMKEFIEDRSKPKAERKYKFDRIVFSTSLKNNLPWKDLQAILDPTVYDKHVLVAKPYIESVEEAYRTCSDLKQRQLKALHLHSQRELWGVLRKLQDARENLENAKKNNIPNREKMISLAYDTLNATLEDFRKKESDFRADVRRAFFNAAKKYLRTHNDKEEFKGLSVDKKIRYASRSLLSGIEWQWLPEFYPVSLTGEKSVIFMSVSKLINMYDTVIGPRIHIYNSEFAKNTLFIIDEVDSAKIMMVQNLLEADSFSKSRIDPTEMFRAVHKALQDISNHPPAFYIPYNDPESSRLRDFANDLLAEADKITEEFNLNKRFCLKDGVDTRFVFHDYRALAVSGGLPVYYEENGKNVLDLQFDGTVEERMKTLESLFGRIDRFFKYFASLISTLAYNYMQSQNRGGDICTIDIAIKTILDGFELASVYDLYLESLVQKYNQKTRNALFDNDASFYNNGFKHYEIESAREHWETSKMFRTAYEVTPEKIILQLLSWENAKIIGISATATIYSVISNFDVNYLYSTDSPCKPYKLSEERLNALKEMYERSVEYYDERLRIHTEAIDEPVTPDDRIIKDPRNRTVFQNILDNAVHECEAESGSKAAYVRQRYRRFALAYRAFVEKSIPEDGRVQIYSELALFNISVKEGSPWFGDDVLKAICKVILEDIGDTGEDLREVPFMSLRGKEYFEPDFSNISERLAEKKRVFIVSAYQTVGLGQNLQYIPHPDINAMTAHTNSFPKSAKKDIDAIYLDSITNIVPYVRKDEYESRDRLIYNIEELTERGELTAKEKNSLISDAFDACQGNRITNQTLKPLESVVLACIRTIEQAVGRITRTNNKNPDVYIFADSNLAGFFKLPLVKYGELRSREFDKLYEMMRTLNYELKERTAVEESKDIASAKASKRIRSLLDGVFEHNADAIAEYDTLGELTLKHPTCDGYLDGGEFPSLKTTTFYTRLREPADNMHYLLGEHESSDRPYADVLCEQKVGPMVSAEDCNLAAMMKYPLLRKRFEENGYATEFKPGHYILAPATYNRIYKGRLGEAAGKFILESLGITVLRMPDEIYEMFDFRIGDGVYVDFKNWNTRQNRDVDTISYMDTSDKLAEIGGRKVYIINIVKPDWDMPVVNRRTVEGREIVEIAYLLDESNTLCSKAVAALQEEI